ncbi:MAG: Fic family protein [Lamprobacter sp.]|uniref:Fic family protein n=1 Tax=Lamprobacter sp. TaxID=3100796 RepID=UPI002B25890A|nr:Fic family protein [Lamprobacter sp.]MEA3642548.1 Fic family protein [Lamprobacter sp.]
MWTWQHQDWPNFRYDTEAFRSQVETFHLKSERLMGRVEALPADLQTDAVIGLMLSEAIKTSAIEGESLDRDSVRASLLQLIAQDSVAPRHQDEKAAGAAALMVDVRKHWAEPLDDALLGRWQSMVVVHQPLSLVMRGLYRNAPEPMRIVSGVYGRERIDYEAPPAATLYQEMALLLNWYNRTNPLTAKPAEVISGPVRAAIAHVWFELIHPFDDGNGRVGRAIADHALSQSLGYPTLACLATAIERDRRQYYDALQQISRGSLDFNPWIAFFIDAVNQAQEVAREEIDFVLGKARFWERYAGQLNTRQSRMVSRVFAEGTKGFEGGISTRKYEAICKCSRATAYRDLSALVKMGVLEPLPGGGRNTRYQLSKP